MSEINTSLTLSDVCERLEAQNSFVILTHTRPDADTLGSAVALSEILSQIDKTVYIINDDDIPKRLQFITGTASLRPEEVLPEGFVPDLFVSVDVSASKLFGKLEAEYAPKIALAIDHHALGTPFAPETVVRPVGACGEIIFDIAKEFEKRGKKVLTKRAAIALYAAICSDTGSFKFESVTPETHIRIASLLEVGFDHAEVARKLYDSRPISQVIATKVALNALHFYNSNRVAVINFTAKMRTDNNLTREDIDDIISLTRSIEGVEIGMSIKQSDDDPTLYKVSMRSNRVADVSKICAVFGGGGHVRASGCTLNAANEVEAEARLMEAIDSALAELDSLHAFDNAGAL